MQLKEDGHLITICENGYLQTWDLTTRKTINDTSFQISSDKTNRIMYSSHGVLIVNTVIDIYEVSLADMSPISIHQDDICSENEKFEVSAINKIISKVL